MGLDRRKPWLAVVLTILAVGVGHVYCGRLARGLLFLAVPLIGVPVAVAVTLALPGDASLWVLVALVLAQPAVTVIAAVDAWRIARRTGDGVEPRAFQRPAVYALSIATVFVFSWTEAFVMKHSLLEAFVIPTRSMEPTLRDGDRFLVNKLRFALRPVERGDVVVYWSAAVRQSFAKRVIGLPGDVVEGRGGQVLVNHEALPLEPADAQGGTQRERIGDRTHLVRPGGDFLETTVPDGAYFVLGDNRPASRDSRVEGPIAAADVRGRVECRFFVRDDWRRLGALDR